jgi:hypothetical protein
MVCQHGWKHAPRDPFNKEIVIDLDDIYVSLGDLAESVRPRNKLYNTVAEIGINIIKRENQNPKKVIMPLHIAVSYVQFVLFLFFLDNQIELEISGTHVHLIVLSPFVNSNWFYFLSVQTVVPN